MCVFVFFALQPIFLRGEDAKEAMEAAKAANVGKETSLELRSVALKRMAHLLITGLIPDPDYIRFVPSSRSIAAIKDLEEAKAKSEAEGGDGTAGSSYMYPFSPYVTPHSPHIFQNFIRFLGRY